MGREDTFGPTMKDTDSLRSPDMAALTPDMVLQGCDDLQRAAITSPAAPLLVVAGAGSGKTRVLTRRIAWRILAGDARPERALALTFTRKAAHELRIRLAGLGLSSPVYAGTFHSVALAELRRLALDRGRPMPVLIDSKQRLLDHVTPKRVGEIGSRRLQLNRVASEIEWAKARRIPPEQYARDAQDARLPPMSPREIASIYASYEEEKRKRVILDLDDLLERLTTELETDPNFAAASQWRFKHLFVDELQDANPAQLALLDAWLGASTDLFAVGDARQAIYGWNGAEPEAMEHFARTHPGTTTLSLTTNYRSTKEIVAVASSLLSDRTTHAARTDEGIHPTVVGCADEHKEAEAVAQGLVRAHAAGVEWSECAVLARTNLQLDAIADACNKAGVPLRTPSARPFLESPMVDRSLAPIARSRDTQRFGTWMAQLVKRAGEPAEIETVDRSDAESSLAGFALEYGSLDPVPTGQGFVAFLQETADPSGTRGGVPGVDLLTLHRAKGLEWGFVWVVGLENGYVPLVHATTEAQLAEERRLLYVALTRARDALHCSWSMSRQMRNRTVRRTRSPFLDPVVATLAGLPPSEFDPHRSARLGLAASRDALRRRRASQ
jgi:DNA helicase-2/ATP-dependent DNA helicase PcrA